MAESRGGGRGARAVPRPDTGTPGRVSSAPQRSRCRAGAPLLQQAPGGTDARPAARVHQARTAPPAQADARPPGCSRRAGPSPRGLGRSQPRCPRGTCHGERRTHGTEPASSSLSPASSRVLSRPRHPGGPRHPQSCPSWGSPGRWGAHQGHTATGGRGAGPRPSLTHALLSTLQPWPLFTGEGTGKAWVSGEWHRWPCALQSPS